MTKHSNLLNGRTHLTILINSVLITSSLQEQQDWPENHPGKNELKFYPLALILNLEKMLVKLFFCLITTKIAKFGKWRMQTELALKQFYSPQKMLSLIHHENALPCLSFQQCLNDRQILNLKK